jgi:hypothetical protein
MMSAEYTQNILFTSTFITKLFPYVVDGDVINAYYCNKAIEGGKCLREKVKHKLF